MHTYIYIPLQSLPTKSLNTLKEFVYNCKGIFQYSEQNIYLELSFGEICLTSQFLDLT